MEAHIHKHTQRHALSLTNPAQDSSHTNTNTHVLVQSISSPSQYLTDTFSLFSLLSNLFLSISHFSISISHWCFFTFSLFLSFSLLSNLFLFLAHSLILILVVSQGVWYQGPYLSRNISLLIQLLHLLIDQLIVQQIALALKETGIIFWAGKLNLT